MKFLIKYIIAFLILIMIWLVVSFISSLIIEHFPVISFIMAVAVIGFFAYKIVQ